MKKGPLLWFVVLLPLFIEAQTVSVSGFYIDKKNNPVEEAFVKYFYADGLLADSTYTSGTGFFTLYVNTTVGTNEPADPLFEKPFPNPFSNTIRFKVRVSEPALVTVTGISSGMVNKLSIPAAGLYDISWGGLGSSGKPVPSGVYIISVVSSNYHQSHKIIYRNSGGGNGTLAIRRLGNNVFKSVAAIDHIEFTKANTSFQELFLNNPTQDTSLGNITANVGPDNLSGIVTVVHIDSLNQWMLNPHFYNDDQSSYQVDDTLNFAIVNDTILQFIGTETGLYEPMVTATDTIDGNLTDVLEAEITVTDEAIVEISGFYLDKLDNPIEAADVYYYKQGNELLGQTITESDGWFALNITSDSATSDTMKFEKPNTTDLSIGFFTPSADTSLGDVIGNVGPENTGQLVVTSHLDSTNQWNLNNYFYNDEQSEYQVDDTLNFEILDDTLLAFIGSSSGQYYPQTTATDTVDPLLEDYMTADITITEERTIEVSGTYIDKLGDPIATADVFYYKAGTQLLGQTTTDADGDFQLSVYVESTTTDSLFFEKENTSDYHLGFITPWADTAFGNLTGNIGPTALSDIDELHFTIENSAQWNLNTYFANDDQSTYSLTGTDFSIVEDTLLQLVISGKDTATTTVTATDPQDGVLTADMEVSVEVEYTINIPDTTMMEDSPDDTLFADLDVFINPNFQNDLSYTIVGQSNPSLINLLLSGTAVLIDSLQTDGHGNSVVEIEIDDSFDLDTVSFTVTVAPLSDVSGQVIDLHDSSLLAGVAMSFVQNGDTLRDTTDANGNYSLQFGQVTDTAYIALTLRRVDKTPFHTWAVLIDNADTVFNYSMIDTSFYWELYNQAFRGNLRGNISGYGHGNMQWTNPPVINVFRDSSFVGGQDLSANVATMLDNLENILPTFNPRDAIYANVVVHDTFTFPIDDYEVAIYWDNSIYPAAGVALIAPVGDGPEILKAMTKYLYAYDPNEADNRIYNQELGTVFGATEEPTTIPPDETVFHNGANVDTYTENDYNCADVYLNRSRIHYWNQDYDGLEGYDWEIRPDSVSVYYPGDAAAPPVMGKIIYYIFYPDGSREVIHYKYDKVPEEVKLTFPEMFDGYIEKRQELERKKAGEKK